MDLKCTVLMIVDKRYNDLIVLAIVSALDFFNIGEK